MKKNTIAKVENYHQKNGQFFKKEHAGERKKAEGEDVGTAQAEWRVVLSLKKEGAEGAFFFKSNK